MSIKEIRWSDPILGNQPEERKSFAMRLLADPGEQIGSHYQWDPYLKVSGAKLMAQYQSGAPGWETLREIEAPEGYEIAEVHLLPVFKKKAAKAG